MMLDPNKSDPRAEARSRARAIAQAGGLDQAVAKGSVPKLIDCTLSEALVLGLLKQGVRKYFTIFGHGSTDFGDVLRVYQEEGVTRTINCRNEVEMAHAATALRWQYGEPCAVVTSIGPGALQAMAGSLACAAAGAGKASHAADAVVSDRPSERSGERNLRMIILLYGVNRRLECPS